MFAKRSVCKPHQGSPVVYYDVDQAPLIAQASPMNLVEKSNNSQKDLKLSG